MVRPREQAGRWSGGNGAQSAFRLIWLQRDRTIGPLGALAGRERREWPGLGPPRVCGGPRRKKGPTARAEAEEIGADGAEAPLAECLKFPPTERGRGTARAPVALFYGEV